MNRSLGFVWLVILIAALLSTGCGSVPDKVNAAAAAPEGTSTLPFAGNHSDTSSARADELIIPAGTPISIRLQNALSSASNRPGDEFAAVVDEPIVVDGKTVIARGASVRGRVVAARSSGRMHHSGYLRLALISIDMNGKSVPVHSSSVFAMGGTHKKRNFALIGGGAGAGAIIGALAGGGSGALIGSAVGAGAGTAGAYATGKKEVSFAPERRLTFRLTQPLVSNPAS